MLGSSVDPTLYWLRAFRRQEEYYNSRVRDETPNSIRKRLAALAAEVGADEDQVLKLISWTGESINSGTGVTIDTKYHMKLGRYVGHLDLCQSYSSADWDASLCLCC